MKFDIYATVELKDAKGKTTLKFTKPLNSYVLGLIDILQGLFNATAAPSNVSIPDTANSARAFNTLNLLWNNGYPMGFQANAASANDTYGIQIGTSNTAIGIADYHLNTKITHGTTSGKLQYGACSIGAAGTTGTTRQFTISRTFTNLSGGDITVEEVGLILGAYYSSSYGYFMIEHSLLNFTVTNGTSGTVTYTISATA